MTVPKVPEECEELQDEIHQLEKELKERQDKLLQLLIKRNRHKASQPKKTNVPYVRPQVR